MSPHPPVPQSGVSAGREAWFTVRWQQDRVVLLDQRRLPNEEVYLELHDPEAVARAIESMAIRGAPAIGCAAAFGVALAAERAREKGAEEAARAVEAAAERLGRTRPTARNLFWALERMRRVLRGTLEIPGVEAPGIRDRLVAEAETILAEDVAACRAIGRAGLALVPERARILTHCNAGALATGGYGTALGMVRAAAEAGRRVEVLADETRPFLQGARLTAWELRRDGIPVTVIADSMAAALMRQGAVDLVVVGADRVAANGDVVNKIGTYGVAVLAREHGIPFVVAAPVSTIDVSIPEGGAIPIEERPREELARIGSEVVVPDGVPVLHPAFDVTPAALVTALVTEAGVLRAPYEPALRALTEAVEAR